MMRSAIAVRAVLLSLIHICVPVELPDLKGREEILKVHAKKVALAPGIDFNTDVYKRQV